MHEPFPKQSLIHKVLQKKTFKNIVGKEENAGNQHFLLFPQCFLPYLRHTLSFKQHKICRLQMHFNLVEAKIVSFGKELILFSCLQCFIEIVSL